MVQGLAFLSKKSWHTKNKVNQEKVWIAEQQKEQEVAKANELAKEIQQERENEELNRIAGKTTIKDRGIDWMYQEGTNHELAKEDAQKEAEEFLLGKEFVGEGAVQGDFHDGNQKEGICNALSKTTEAAAGIKQQQPELQKYRSEAQVNADHNSVHYRNENFRMRNEDPMFLVSQKQRENKDKHEHVKELYQRVVGNVEDKESSDDDGGGESARNKKRLKKERKRHKKEKKKKKKSSRGSSDYEESDRSHSRRYRRRSRSRSYNRSRSSSRSRSRSNERNRRRYRSDDGDRDRDRDYDSRSDGSYDGRRDRYRGDKYHDRQHDKMDHRDRRNRRHYDEEKSKYYNNDSKDDRKYSRNIRRDHNDEKSSSRKNAPSYTSKQNNKREPPKKIEGYGLKGAPTPVFDSRDIGPSKELLRKKKDEIEQIRRQNNQKGSRKILTEEERAIALRQMQTDAKTREDRMGRQASYRKNDVDEEKEASTRKGASFLNDITKGAHGLEGNNSLSSRVAQNRHTQQRLHDNFL
jgi:hypothetical protein